MSTRPETHPESRPGARLYVTMLGCVSPYETDIGETMNTLQFVSDAKKMTPKLNTFVSEYQVNYVDFHLRVKIKFGFIFHKLEIDYTGQTDAA